MWNQGQSYLGGYFLFWDGVRRPGCIGLDRALRRRHLRIRRLLVCWIGCWIRGFRRWSLSLVLLRLRCLIGRKSLIGGIPTGIYSRGWHLNIGLREVERDFVFFCLGMNLYAFRFLLKVINMINFPVFKVKIYLNFVENSKYSNLINIAYYLLNWHLMNEIYCYFFIFIPFISQSA